MEKKPMCLSREEQDSIRALAGTVEETVELSQSLYQAVVQVEENVPLDAVVEVREEPPTKRALRTAALPMFDEDKPKD